MSNYIICPIDPINGNDSTGTPIINNKPINYYKTIKFAYTQQRLISKDALLSMDVLRGTVSLDFDIYNTQIFSDPGQAKLEIYDNDSTLHFQNVTLSIDTVIILSKSNESIIETVIETINYFELVSSYTLDIREHNETNDTEKTEKTEKSNKRNKIIFDHKGICFVQNTGGIVDLSTRNSIIHKIGGVGIIGLFDKINMTTKSTICYVDGFNNNVSGLQLISNSTKSEINLYPAVESIVTSSINWDKLLWGVGITIVGGILTIGGIILSPATGGVSILISTIGVGVLAIGIKFISFSLIKRQLLNNKEILSIESIISKHPNVKKFTGLITKIYNKKSVDQSYNLINILGGSIINSTPDKLKLSLTNYPSNIDNVNLVDVDKFAYNESLEISPENYSNYNLTNDTNSYDNSGSIFMKCKLITSNYTHAKFDGYNFIIDASKSDILITVPEDVLNNRTFQYKRIDCSRYRVKIITKNGIDNCKEYNLNYRGRKLPKVKLIGYGGKLWII